MNPSLPIRPLGRSSHDLLRMLVSVSSASRWWVLCLLLTGLSTSGRGQCFTKTTLYAGPGTLGVAVGDFNGDGRPDLVSSNVGISGVTVRLGNGSGGFGGPIMTTAGQQPIPIAVADFNGDGRADLALGNDRSDNVTVLLGNGTGSFGAATGFPVGRGASAVVAADFNGDGKVDLATANGRSNDVSVLLGIGSGSFGAATNFPVGDSPISMVVGDFNGDGRPDLATANAFSNNVSVLLGTGSGSFGAAINFLVGTFPRSVAVGDFNGDSRPDLAVTNAFSNTVSLLLGTGSGGFGAATNFPVGASPGPIAVGDFNGDGRPDLAVTIQRSNPNFSVDDNVSVLLNDGSGGFMAATDFPVGSDLGSTVVGDFNGDGRPDLAGTSGFSAIADELLVLINCSLVITGVTPVSCATVTATERQLTFTPQYAGITGQPINFSVVNELSPITSPGPYTLRLYTDNPTITLRATQAGTPGEASFNYNWLAACGASPPPPPGFAITGATVNCQMVSATERRVMLSPQYAGVTGQPISFSVVNELSPITSPGPYTLRLYTDNPTITLKATQTGSPREASFNYNWLAACGGGGVARLGESHEPTVKLQMKLLGNPVRETVEVEITGAENRALQVSLTDMMGRIIGQSRTERAGTRENYRFDVSALPAGTLLLRTTQGQSETVRILKLN